MNLKEKIIHETIKLFSLKGFLSTSINDILRETSTSKGGLYNHFNSKEALFFAVLSESRKLWRGKCLAGLDQIEKPIDKVIKFLENYRDRYLKDYENFPGGCIFVTLSVELSDQRPHLARELNGGFVRLKAMINRLLDQSKEAGEIRDDVSIEGITEMIFSGMLGASVTYGIDKSNANLDHTINSLSNYLRTISD
ncbi:MAG: TetR/AcrR family transcriptional regulator [Proteobacteria bacterium]|nr:TetR/AcrR family transcriptional regulator [Pseudomonadota bacterium]